MGNNNEWDLKRLRAIAGTTITESVDDTDDDDMSPAEKALAAKAEADLKKAGVKVKKINPEKDISKLAAQSKAKKDADDTEESDDTEKSEQKQAKSKTEKPAKSPWAAAKDTKVEAPAKEAEKKPEEKKEEKKEELPASKKAPAAREWIKNNPGAKRGEFLKWAASNLQMGTAYASTLFAKYNPKSGRGAAVSETYYVLTHPSVPKFLLAENRFNGGSYVWIDPSSDIQPLVFTAESEAKELANYMKEWKGQQTVVEIVTI